MRSAIVVLAGVACAACGGQGSGGGARGGGPGGGPPVGPPEIPVVVENALSGGDGWQLHHAAAPGVLEAYAGEVSVEHGEPVNVHARSNRAARVTWEAWRIGWYGGAGGRRVASGGPIDLGPQPTPAPDPATGRIACRWPVSFTVDTDRSWTSGVYLVVLTRDDGAQTYAPLVVRADERKGVAAYQASVTTWQAYNAWGGKSLYDGGPAVEVSFDRPYAEGDGAGQFLWYEVWFVHWAESRGLDLTYLTDVDVDRDPSLVAGQKLFLSVGHDEYWSRPEREGVEAALAAGTSLAFFGANAAYWQIRLEPSRDDGTPRRTQVCWKKRADAEDPLRGTPLETTKWRLPPVSQPENALIGVMFTAWTKQPPLPWIVVGASAWPYDGTGVKDGDRIDGIVGYETDGIVDNGETPPGLVQLAGSPVTDVSGEARTQVAAVRDAPGGAFVFAAGTIEWSWGLGKPGTVDPRVQRITENVFRRAGLEPSAP